MSRNCFCELQDIHSTPSTPPEHEQHHKAFMEYCQSDYFSLRGVKLNQMFHKQVCFWLQRISPWGQSSEVMSKTGALRHAGDDTNQASFHPPRHQYWHDGRESTFTYTGRITKLDAKSIASIQGKIPHSETAPVRNSSRLFFPREGQLSCCTFPDMFWRNVGCFPLLCPLLTDWDHSRWLTV